MDYKILKDKCRGCLVAGAAGDALGYEVEFISRYSILKHYGPDGITRYSDDNNPAIFSDDTQMTLFTAEGILRGALNTGYRSPEAILPYVEEAYKAWYRTQTQSPRVISGSWLSHIAPLWVRRAPGNTCMNSLQDLCAGLEVKNNSKGCGGVMRVAPVGILGAARPTLITRSDTARLAALVAEITHHHPDSSLASALCALIIRHCITDSGTIDRTRFSEIVLIGLDTLKTSLSPLPDNVWNGFHRLMLSALELGRSDLPADEAIHRLGEGWVGDEALAIAIYAVTAHIGSVQDCIVCAVNHNGDSDSTGAIAGNIIGAILGYSAIPERLKETLQLEPLIVSIADDLCAPPTDPEAGERIEGRYRDGHPVDVADKYILK